MKKQQGKISAVGAVILTVGVLVVAVLGGSYISAYNEGNRMEQDITATYANNQNILSNYTEKVLEASQVTDMMRDDMVKVVKAALESRYGDAGSKAVFQAVQEHNPQVSERLYSQLQDIIKAGRDEFQDNQTRLIDQKRAYNQALGSFWQGAWLKTAGYPRIKLDDYKVVLSDKTRQTFQTGTDSPIQLRK